MNTRLSAAIETARRCYRRAGGDEGIERVNIAAFVHSAVATLIAKLHEPAPPGNPESRMWVPLDKLIDPSVYSAPAAAPNIDEQNLKTLQQCALAGLVTERIVEVQTVTATAQVRLR